MHRKTLYDGVIAGVVRLLAWLLPPRMGAVSMRAIRPHWVASMVAAVGLLGLPATAAETGAQAAQRHLDMMQVTIQEFGKIVKLRDELGSWRAGVADNKILPDEGCLGALNTIYLTELTYDIESLVGLIELSNDMQDETDQWYVSSKIVDSAFLPSKQVYRLRDALTHTSDRNSFLFRCRITDEGSSKINELSSWVDAISPFLDSVISTHRRITDLYRPQAVR